MEHAAIERGNELCEVATPAAEPGHSQLAAVRMTGKRQRHSFTSGAAEHIGPVNEQKLRHISGRFA